MFLPSLIRIKKYSCNQSRIATLERKGGDGQEQFN